jgi:hypothetical protein
MASEHPVTKRNRLAVVGTRRPADLVAERASGRVDCLRRTAQWSATWVARVPVSAAPEREICGALATSQLALKQPNSGRGDSGRFGPSARAVRRLATAASYRSEVTGVAVLMIARFSGDVAERIRAYDRAHAMIMAAGGAEQFGELWHHCATGQDALYIIGVWQSEEHVRTRWQSSEFEERLVSVGFPSPKTADITILDLRAIEPPL